MNITAVQNIPYADRVFACIGNVTIISDKDLSPQTIQDTDILLVRSTRKIDEPLLKDSAVKFVGTATIGYDHVDLEYLAGRNIRFVSAPGSNADSVSEYVTAALLEVADRLGWELAEKTIGVIGCGNVGSRVVKKARALGMRVIENDPPLAHRTGDTRYRPIEELFAADVITCHVPLTKDGPDKTLHLIDGAFFFRMKNRSVLINSSRGAVVDPEPLGHALDSHRLMAAVLDVWENEPSPDPDLIDRMYLATPHIAGHSFDGKVNGTMMLYRAVCAFLDRPADFDIAPLLPKPDVPFLRLAAAPPQAMVREAVSRLYDIWSDDKALRKIADLSAAERGAYFSGLRKNYRPRREFTHTRIELESDVPGVRETLAGLGFITG